MAVDIRSATPADLPSLMALVEAFYAIDGHPFSDERVRTALTELITHERFGHVWVATRHADDAQPLSGYAVATWGYSLEAGGREAVLDEIFTDPRGAGIGSLLLDAVIVGCREAGMRRVFLETEQPNHGARNFYLRNGFDQDDSIWMSRWLT